MPGSAPFFWLQGAIEFMGRPGGDSIPTGHLPDLPARIDPPFQPLSSL